jgi:hypothetical protein
MSVLVEGKGTSRSENGKWKAERGSDASMMEQRGGIGNPPEEVTAILTPELT